MTQNKEQFVYSGIPTFMGSNYINDISKINGYDVAFLGIPSDYGASYRLGAKYAVRKMREYSFWDRIEGKEFYDIDNEQFVKSNSLNIVDVGDIDVNPTNPTQHQEEIKKAVYNIRKKCFPLICGGDHSITYGSFIGCMTAFREKNPNSEFGIIHFDAHLDVESSYLSMPKVWHGNFLRCLIEDGYVMGENVFTIGVRGCVDREWIDYSKNNNINYYSSNYISKKGIKKVVEEIVNYCLRRKLKIYLTFDVDCLDISYIKGTGTPQSNGLSEENIKQFFKYMNELEIIGFDMVELNPVLDPSGASFVLACSILFEFLAFTFKKEQIL